MATYNWSALNNGQVVAFVPGADTLFIDDLTISAANMRYVATPTPTAANGTFTLIHGGKSVTFGIAATSPSPLASLFFIDDLAPQHRNIKFADGSRLVVGDNTLGIADDSLANAMTGSNFDDVFIGLGGSDTLDGGLGIDTADYSDAPAGVLGTTGLISYDGQAGADTLIGIENIVGSAFADSLTGDGNDNVFRPAAGNDTLNGGGGSNTVDYSDAPGAVVCLMGLGFASNDGYGGVDSFAFGIHNVIGSAFNDILGGYDVPNTFTGGAGNDTIEGVDAFDAVTIDTVDYSRATAGMTVDLSLNLVGNDGQGGVDTLSSIERIVGSPFGDIIVGDGNANLLMGGAGNDTIHGAQGIDLADYSAAKAGVVVELWRDQANDGEGGTDILWDLENVTGSAFSDILAGDTRNNVFKGGAGNDGIYGGGGIDTIDYSGVVSTLAVDGVTVDLSVFLSGNDGQGGADTLVNIENIIGSRQNDILVGDNNANVFVVGNLGNDTINGGGGADTVDYSDLTNVPFAVVINLAQGHAFATNRFGGFVFSHSLFNIEDVIGSSIRTDIITGDSNNNQLDGGQGGQDSLTGGGGADSFVFRSNNLADIIFDFSKAQGDKIHLQSNLNGSGITSGALALAHAVNQFGDVIVDLGGGNKVTLIGVELSTLDASDFVII
jgi:Ca2+-binding RTX toxin-like protein